MNQTKSEKTQSAATTRLAGANYLYMLRRDPDPVEALRSYLLKSYNPLSGNEGPQLNLSQDDSAHFYLVNQETEERIDAHIHSAGNTIAACIVYFEPPGRAPDWTEQARVLDDCEAALRADEIDVLGSALVVVAGDDGTTLNQLKAALPNPEGISAAVQGQVIHQFLSPAKRQHFLIESGTPMSVHDLIAKELPQLSWTIEKLRRETVFYNDRLATIMAEKTNIDAELSKIFHQKVSSELTPEAAEGLEKQIARLSSMYSVLATNLHLIREAVSTLENDLTTLERQARGFDPAGDEGFPRHHVQASRAYLEKLEKYEADVRLSLDNTKAAIDIAQTQAEIIRGAQGLVWQEQTRELLNQNVTIQEERVSLQIAAEVIELVVIFYYALKSWEAVAPSEAVHALPPFTKFSVVALFSGAVVALAHYIGASLHRRKIKVIPIALAALFLVASIAAMAILPGGAHD